MLNTGLANKVTLDDFEANKLNEGSFQVTDGERYDIEEIGNLLVEYSPQIKAANDKDLVFVIGPTGSGKSTLTNYLLGYRLKLEDEIITDELGDERLETRIVFTEVNERHKRAPIGNKMESETLYPQFYEKKIDELTLAYADCPGFEGVRTNKAYRIFESVSMQMAFATARSIQALIVVVDYRALDAQRGALFTDLSKMLGKFIAIPEKVADCVLFVFTHLDNEQVLLKAKPKIQQNTVLNKINQLNKLYLDKRDAIVRQFEESIKVKKSKFYICSLPNIEDLKKKIKKLPKKGIMIIKETQSDKEKFYFLISLTKLDIQPIELSPELFSKLDFPKVSYPPKKISEKKITEEMRKLMLAKYIDALQDLAVKHAKQNGNELEDIERTLDIFSIMLKHPNNIFLTNVFDKGECRLALEKRLVQINQKKISLDKKNFKFHTYDNMRSEFDSLIFKMVLEGRKLIKKEKSLAEDIARCSEQYQNCSEEIVKSKEQIAKIQSLHDQDITDIKNGKEISVQMELQRHIDVKSDFITQIEKRLQETVALKHEIGKKINELDKGDSTFLQTESFIACTKKEDELLTASVGTAGIVSTGIGSVIGALGGAGIGALIGSTLGPVGLGVVVIGGALIAAGTGLALEQGVLMSTIFGMFALGHHAYKFSYKGKIPLTKVEHSHYSEKETWTEDKANDLKNCLYVITYKSGFQPVSYAEVNYYVARKDHPDNVAEIEDLKKELDELDVTMKDDNSKKVRYEEEIRQLKINIANLENALNGKIDDIERKLTGNLQNLEQIQESYAMQKQLLEKEKNRLSKERIVTLASLEKNKKLYEAIVELIKIIDYSHHHKAKKLRDFIKVYEKYERNKMRSHGSSSENLKDIFFQPLHTIQQNVSLKETEEVKNSAYTTTIF